MPSCNGRHLPLNNEGAGALWWHTEVQIPISNQAENPRSQIVREVDVCEGENPQGCHYPWIYLRKQWPALSFRWRCLAADLSAQRCPEDTSRTFPGVFLTACLPPGGQGHRVPPSLHALKRQQVTCMEATDASRQQRAWQYGGQSWCTQIWHKLVFWRIVQALFFCRVFLKYFPRHCSATSSAQDWHLCLHKHAPLRTYPDFMFSFIPCWEAAWRGKTLRWELSSLFLESWVGAEQHHIDCKELTVSITMKQISFLFLSQVSPF